MKMREDEVTVKITPRFNCVDTRGNRFNGTAIHYTVTRWDETVPRYYLTHLNCVISDTPQERMNQRAAFVRRQNATEA